MDRQRVLRAVTGQIDWWWDEIFRPRLRGLTEAQARSVATYLLSLK